MPKKTTPSVSSAHLEKVQNALDCAKLKYVTYNSVLYLAHTVYIFLRFKEADSLHSDGIGRLDGVLYHDSKPKYYRD